MDFARLLETHSVEIEVFEESPGTYDCGKYVPGDSISQKRKGAIVPINDRKVYQSGGVYTADDRELILKEPIDGKPAKVQYGGTVYTVEEEKDYGHFANVFIYVLKRVSVHDQPKGCRGSSGDGFKAGIAGPPHGMRNYQGKPGRPYA